jgi:acetyl-CoA synthetase
VCKFANVLKQLGIKTGDRVTLYMPMIPELAIAMLACARIGAPHSIIFGGFSADAVAERNNDAQAKLVVTADGGWRRGREIELKSAVDTSLERSPTVENVVVVRRTGSPVSMEPGRDYWWHDLMESASADCDPTEVDSRASAVHPLHLGKHREAQGVCTPPAATSWEPDDHQVRLRSQARQTSTGAPPTSAG